MNETATHIWVFVFLDKGLDDLTYENRKKMSVERTRHSNAIVAWDLIKL